MTKKQEENIWKKYEREKAKIRKTNPTPEKYEKEIKKVIKKLGV